MRREGAGQEVWLSRRSKEDITGGGSRDEEGGSRTRGVAI